MKSKPFVIAAVGGIVTLVTLLIFTLLLPPVGLIGWLCLVFVLVAELVGFTAAVLLAVLSRTAHKTLLGAGAAAILGLYMLVSVAVSLVFRLFFVLWLGGAALLVSLQLVLLGAMAVALLVLLHFAVRAEEREQKTLDKVDYMRVLAQRIALLATNMEGEQADILTKAAQEVLYTDLTVVVEGDAALQEPVAALDIEQHKPQPDPAQLEALVGKVQNLVRQRSIALIHAKHGAT